MDILEKYLRNISYKFPKGYPDMKDKQDVSLLESELKKLGINIILENQDLIKLLRTNIKDYGDIDVSGKDTLKVTFSDIPNRGAQADSMRKDVYDEIKSLVDKEESLSDFQKLSTGSSLGSVVINFNGKRYKLIVKGASSDTSSDTDVKEALVSLFYITNISN